MNVLEVIQDLFADNYNIRLMPACDTHEGIDDHDETPTLVIQPREPPLKSTIHVIILCDIIYLYNGYRPIGRWDLANPESLDKLIATVDQFYAAPSNPTIAA